MSRDWTPIEHYMVEQRQIKQGYGDLFNFLENMRFISTDGKETIVNPPEDMVIRRQFPMLGKLLMDDFMTLHEKLSDIPGGVEFLHKKDDELAEMVQSKNFNRESYLAKWFLGKLDERFYYSDRNNELFCDNILLEAQLLADKIWICVYKDALGYQDDNDNLTYILLPPTWLKDQLKADGIEDFDDWFADYTADDTDGIARKALAEGVILDCQDKHIKLAGPDISEDLFNKACEYYKEWVNIDEIDGDGDFLHSHADKLIYCYENKKDLIDFDFWVQYEALVGEKISWDEYLAIDSKFDGDPHDVVLSDVEVIAGFKKSLVEYRQGKDVMQTLDDSICVGDRRLYNTHGQDTELNCRSGQVVEVLRELQENEVDIDDVGPMYRVRFPDGYERDAFVDELEIKALPLNDSIHFAKETQKAQNSKSRESGVDRDER